MKVMISTAIGAAILVGLLSLPFTMARPGYGAEASDPRNPSASMRLADENPDPVDGAHSHRRCPGAIAARMRALLERTNI